MQTWLITGANGNLGRRLVTTLLANPEHNVVALVRSQRAAETVRSLPLDEPALARLRTQIVDYTDPQAIAEAAVGCTHAVHLVGILKETRQASYSVAHQASTQALLQALSGGDVQHITYMSIVGSQPGSGNACLASKGAAEQMLRDSAMPACVIRVPMVLGEGDYASFALGKRARAAISVTFRAASLEQPIYAGDVVDAIILAGQGGVDASVDLGGPEVLSRRALSARAAAVLGTSSTLLSLPIGLGYAFAWLMQSLVANPPITSAMLGVLNHDDAVDPELALQTLGLAQLTPLDTMLQRVLQPA